MLNSTWAEHCNVELSHDSNCSATNARSLRTESVFRGRRATPRQLSDRYRTSSLANKASSARFALIPRKDLHLTSKLERRWTVAVGRLARCPHIMLKYGPKTWRANQTLRGYPPKLRSPKTQGDSVTILQKSSQKLFFVQTIVLQWSCSDCCCSTEDSAIYLKATSEDPRVGYLYRYMILHQGDLGSGTAHPTVKITSDQQTHPSKATHPTADLSWESDRWANSNISEAEEMGHLNAQQASTRK